MTFAQVVQNGSNGFVDIINTYIIPLLFTLIAAVFLWGVVNAFILHPDDERARASGRQFVLWGLIGIVVLLSVWGIVNALLSTLGIAPGS